MSRYEQLQKRNPKDFKRLIGVKKETLEAMIEVFCSYEIERKKGMGVGGRKSLCPEDKVLLMHSNCEIPHKASKLYPLTDDQKESKKDGFG